MIQELEAKKILKVIRRSESSAKLSNIYCFNKDYDEWVVQNSAPQVVENRKRAKRRSAKLRKMGSAKLEKTVSRVVQNSDKGSAKLTVEVVQNSDKKVKSFAHTKEKRNKRKTKERAPLPARDSNGKFLNKNIGSPAVPSGMPTHTEWQEIIDAWKPVNEFYLKFYKNKTQRQALLDIIKKVGKEKMMWVIVRLNRTNKLTYFPVATTPIQLRDKWSSIENAYVKKKVELSGGNIKPDTQQVDRFPAN